jgi:hypothetical protein
MCNSAHRQVGLNNASSSRRWLESAQPAARGVRAEALWRDDCLVGAKSPFWTLRHNCVTRGCSRPRRSGSHLGVRAARGCAGSSPRICCTPRLSSTCWLRATLSLRACSYSVRVGWPGPGSASRDSDARPFRFFDAGPLARAALRLPIESGSLVGNGQFWF